MVFAKIEGLNKTLKKLENIGNIYKDQVIDILSEGGEEIKQIAQDKMKEGNGHPSNPGEAPNKQTSNLADSITVKIAGTTMAVGTGVDYGAWLEFGTSKMEPRPWLKPSYQEALPGIIKKLHHIGLRKL